MAPKLTARQRAYVKKHATYHEPDASELDEELNIIPFLDIVVNLIMFMLMSVATVAFFAQVELGIPQSSTGRGTRGADAEQSLNLTVSITNSGVIVLTTGGTLAPGCTGTQSGNLPTIARQANGDYDWAGLTACLVRVKAEYRDERKVKVAPDANVAYGDFIAAMDAVRSTTEGEELFPEALLVAGIR